MPSGPGPRAIPAASSKPAAAASSARWPGALAVTVGPRSGPGPGPLQAWAVTMSLSVGLDRTVLRGKQADVGSKARSGAAAPGPPTPRGSGRLVEAAGGATTGERPSRVRPSSLDVYEHQAGVKGVVPVGKMCDACTVKLALYPDTTRKA